MNEREYERMYRVENEHWWYVALHDLVLRRVAREASLRPLSILDAGCGTGRLCELLMQMGELSGVDISEHALKFCRMRGIGNVIRADLCSTDLGESRYDVITSIDVLYHTAVRDEVPVLVKFRRALKPGGILILNLPAFEFLRSSHDTAVHTRKRYRRGETVAQLQTLGFDVELAVYRLGLLFFPIAGYRMLKRLTAGNHAETTDSDVFLPPAPVNRFLRYLALAENRFLEKGFGPVGTSVYVVAKAC